MSRISESMSSLVELGRPRGREKTDALVKFPFTNFHGVERLGGAKWSGKNPAREALNAKLPHRAGGGPWVWSQVLQVCV